MPPGPFDRLQFAYKVSKTALYQGVLQTGIQDKWHGEAHLRPVTPAAAHCEPVCESKAEQPARYRAFE